MLKEFDKNISTKWPIVISSSPFWENSLDTNSSDSERTMDVIGEETHLPPPPVPSFVLRDIPGPSARPRWVRRKMPPKKNSQPNHGSAGDRSMSELIDLLQFKGEVDPVATRIWLKEMEKAFELTKVGVYASIRRRRSYPMDLIHRTVLGKYFPDCLQSQMEMEFLELKQKDRSVTEYEAKFTELAHIAPEYAALVIENDQRLAAKEQGENKRKLEGGPARSELGGVIQKFQSRFGKNKDRKFRRQNFPQARPSTTSVSSTPTKFNKPVIDYKACGKKHSGQCKENVNCFKCGQKGHYSTECKFETQGVTCFSSGKVGHIARNCRSMTQGSVGRSVSQGPATSTSRARTFKMTKKSSAHVSDVVAGMLSLNSVPVNVLFDSGASKYFTSMNFVNKMQLMLEDLDEPLTIEVANKYKVPQGCEAYLAHVVDTNKDTPTLDEIPIIREFPGVFLEELPGLSPDREIEFFIDLIPGAEPVFKAPYRLQWK
ncbi:hypothetical protein AgCh_027880 [Apium graveolens]